MKPETVSAPILETRMVDPRTLLFIQGHMWRTVNHQRMVIRKISQENIYKPFIQLQIGLSLKETCALTAASPWGWKPR